MGLSRRGSMSLPNKAPTIEEWIAFKEKQDRQRQRMSFYKKLLVLSQMMERYNDKRTFSNSSSKARR